MNETLTEYFNTGLTPQQFMERMQQHRESFASYVQQFSWTNLEDRTFFASLSTKAELRCFILAADWCGDVIRNVPVIFRALEESGVPIKVLIMEQHLALMDRYLTMGGRAIPIVIFTNHAGEEVVRWGPRPTHVQAIMTQFKLANPDRSAPDYDEKINLARREMIAAYGEGAGYQTVIVQELRHLLSNIRTNL